MTRCPKISIITPSYNQADYLEDTIISVLEQNYPNLEYIIIDGGSTDGSVDIIKKYEDSINYWVSESDRGQSHAINKGFEKATGDIVAWLNSDDLYMPETLKLIAKEFEANPDCDILYGDVINFTVNKDYYYKVEEFEPLDFLSRVSIHQPGVFWRKKVTDEVGLLDETLHYTMDYDLWMRMFFSYKSLKINKPLARFRFHEGSKTTGAPPELYKDSRVVLCRFFNSLPGKDIVQYLKNLNIYINPDDRSYDLKISNYSFVNKAVKQYIFNYAIEEHTFGDKTFSNKLFFLSLKNGYYKSIYFLLKNIFR